ncbi:BrnT family toxin [Marinobacter salexigens]|uniref:BrnT family toxin n=1 Tax=Marinobacter salexigens TaxID=1925763 RepID=UPI000C28DC41|nr:BrnT family toxin [Marinobacter salexigens]
MINWAQVTGFDWDEGNSRKNAEKHRVNQSEAEEIFFNEPLLVLEDSRHSQAEARFHALGETDDERLLHITFTLRQNGTLIRVISARDMHRKERAVYEQVEKDAWV